MAALNRRHAKPEQFTDEMSRDVRENHTQKQFVPAAMYFSLNLWRQLKPALPKLGSQGGKIQRCSPGNVKRKAAAPRARARTEAMI
jgi:hypothetical protein